MPVVDQRQTPTIQTEQKTTDVPQIQCFEPLVDVPVVPKQTAEIPVVMLKQVPVMMRRQIPLVQKNPEDGGGAQIQYIDTVIDALVSMQREVQVQEKSDDTMAAVTTGVNPNTSDAMAPHCKRKGSDTCQSPRLKAGMKERAQDDDHEHETLEMKDVKSELVHVRELIGVLVRKERCAETRAEIAASRLDRLEREQNEQYDKESETNLQEALSDKTKAVKLVIDKWFVDRGFGFGKVPKGETVFVHASVVHGGEVLMVGTDAWVQVVNNEARARGGYRARNACGRNAWKEENDREKANRVTQQVRRAAALTAELAAQSEKKVAVAYGHPPGLRDEPAEHITAPDMGAGGSHPRPK